MTTTAEVIARIAASMARTAAENERLAERARAYTGPERRRSRIAAQQRAGEQAQQQASDGQLREDVA